MMKTFLVIIIVALLAGVFRASAFGFSAVAGKGGLR
jgi:hypothetical protein